MKNSNVRPLKKSNEDWVDSIPSDWAEKKVSLIFEMIGSGTTPSTLQSENYGVGVPWVTTGELRESRITKTQKEVPNEVFAQTSALKKFPVNSIAIAMYGATIGRLAIFGVEACTNQACCVLANPRNGSYQFYYYCFQAAKTSIIRRAIGGGQPNINQDTVRALRFPNPSEKEQRQIAAYLNRETAKIDKLILKQQKLIKLLQEKRLTVISQTITKGLDPNVKMKDSGVEWLGEVPQHWNLLRGKSLFNIRKRIAGKLGFEILSITQKGIKVKDTESGGGQLSMDYSKYQLVFPGDFAMNHMDLLTGYVDISKYHGVTSPDYRVFEMKGDQDTFCSKFYKSVLQNCYHEKLFFPFGQGSSQLGRWRLPTEAFNEFVYPVPPIDEQRAIANLIEVEISKCELLTDKANTCISLLKEHRQALITAAVTGKIDVRGLVTDEEVAALDADPVLETTEEDFESEVAEADYITEEE